MNICMQKKIDNLGKMNKFTEIHKLSKLSEEEIEKQNGLNQ